MRLPTKIALAVAVPVAMGSAVLAALLPPAAGGGAGNLLALVLTMSAVGICVLLAVQRLLVRPLRASEASFTALFDLAPVPLAYTEQADGHGATHWNKEWYHAFGYPPEICEGHNGNAFGLWVDTADRHRYLEAALREGAVSAMEVEMRRADGAIRRVELYGRFVGAGARRLLVTAYFDVTATRNAEAALRARELWLRSLFEVSPVAVLILDMQGRVRECNQRFAEMTGYAAAAVLGHSYFEFVHPGHLEAARQGIGRMLEDASIGVFSAERDYRRQDGSTLHGLLSARRLPASLGNDDALLVIVSDLSELYAARAQQQESETKLREIFNASPTAMIVSDVRRNYAAVAANDAWERQFLRSRAAVMGLTGAEMGLWASVVDRDAVLARIASDGVIDGFETLLVRGDGVALTCRISARKVLAGEEELLVMVQEDVSELRRAEASLQAANEALDNRVRERTAALRLANEELSEALDHLRRAQGDLVRSEKLAALGALVAGVAHELNTPIGNSVMVASALVDQTDRLAEEMQAGLRRSTLISYMDQSRQAADLLLSNLRRAASLVSSFKQVAVDQTSEQRRHFDVAEVVDEILAMLQPQLKKRPIDIVVELPSGVVLDSYPGPFGQVVANLVANAAAHAFPDAAANGHIRIHGQSLAAGYRLVVSDDGVGIPPENIGRIFDPFFTTRLGQGGSGLGLHIVYNIVSGILGGDIRVDSRCGEGCTFTVTLPLVAPERT